LLSEIQDFLIHFEDERSFFKMIVNVEAQRKYQTQLESFYASIHEIQIGLSSKVIDSVDFKEDVKVTMEAMVHTCASSKIDMRDHCLDIVYLKEIVDDLLGNCLKQKTDIVKSKLLDLQNILSSNFQPQQKDIDRAITSLSNTLLIVTNKVGFRRDLSALLFLHCCCFYWNIPVELRMIVCQYVLLKTELSHIST
jgi:chemotaxis regulatin CheY-phosphate phosphatase CheZ